MSISQEIKSRLDIVEIIEEYLPLRKSGRSYTGFCPFHANTRTPAFVVFPDSQTWRCFGACAEGGDIFSFIMKKEGWEFAETLQHLAKRAGVTLEQANPRQQAQQVVEDRLAELLDAAADYFHQLLLYAPQAEHARGYVAQRALRTETIAEFKLGYALESWDACRTHFMGQGYDLDDLMDAGLLSRHEERGTTYDRFRNRLMIPIRDLNGRTVGFGARTFDPDGVPKYLNSPQTTLFDKSRLLYGLDMAKRHIREARQGVIVEGYMDVIQAHQMGFKNVVAQMGTALTEEQLTLLKRYTKRFVIALDADTAGMKATLRSLEVARHTLDRAADTRFDPHGLVRHEGRLQADIRIVTLPPGDDPDKLIRANPGQWPQLIAQAQPIVAYVIGVYTTDLDLNDAKAKAEVVQKVLPLIADVADPVEREHYRQLLARALRIDERTLLKVNLSRPRPPTSQTTSSTTAPPPFAARAALPLGQSFATEKREANYLRQVLTQPHILIEVDTVLQQQEQSPVLETDFSVIEDRMLFRTLRQSIYPGQFTSVEDLAEQLDDLLRERLTYLTSQENHARPSRPMQHVPDTAGSLALSMLNCRLEKIRQQLGAVKLLLEQSDKQRNPELLADYDRRLGQEILRIDRARAAMLAVNRRRTAGNGS